MVVSLKSATVGVFIPWKSAWLQIMVFPSLENWLLNVYQHTTDPKLKSPSGAKGSLKKTNPNKYSDFLGEPFLDAIFPSGLAEVLVASGSALTELDTLGFLIGRCPDKSQENLHLTQCDHCLFFFG